MVFIRVFDTEESLDSCSILEKAYHCVELRPVAILLLVLRPPVDGLHVYVHQLRKTVNVQSCLLQDFGNIDFM